MNKEKTGGNKNNVEIRKPLGVETVPGANFRPKKTETHTHTYTQTKRKKAATKMIRMSRTTDDFYKFNVDRT